MPDQANLAGTNGAVSPMPQPGKAVSIRDSAALTANWVATAIYDIHSARRIALWIKYDAAAIGGYAQIIPLMSAHNDPNQPNTPPDMDDDVWFAPAVMDTGPIESALGGSLPAGAVYTTTPVWRLLEGSGLVIALKPAVAATDKTRIKVVLDVTDAKWLYLAAREASGFAAGTCAIDWSVSL